MPATATKAGGSTTNLDAITTALRLVNGQTSTPDEGAARAPVSALPSARFRVAVDALAGKGTYVALDASRPNLKALISDVVNWTGKPRATKPLTKVVGATMSGTDGKGGSLYPQSLEMLSFLALCAPLLEPDRLARVAALAAQTPNAYKPIRYLVKPAAQLQKLLARYSDARRETLLASLWVTAHEGRWWDATGGTPVGRRRRNVGVAVEAEQAEAIAEQIERVLQGTAAPTARTIADAFEARALTFSTQAAEILGGMRIASEDDRRALVAHTAHPDADVPVLLSYVRDLLPDERAESPIAALIEALVRDLADDIANKDAMPAKPEEWDELYPAASREGFPMSNQLRQLDKAALPGVPGAKIVMMRHADMLQRNATHMGNCTFSYRTRSENGQAFIGHVATATGEYNFAVVVRAGARDGSVTYALGETNSRFNRGDVPPEINRGLQLLLAGLNP